MNGMGGGDGAQLAALATLVTVFYLVSFYPHLSTHISPGD